MQICFIDGKYKSVDKVNVTPRNIGLLRGYGIFEVFRSYNKKFFRFDQHMDRFFNSAKTMNIKVPYTKKEIKEISQKLIEKNDLREGYMRILMTGGEAENGINYNPQKPTFIILARNPKPFNPEYYQKGVELLTLEHKRIIPEVKYTNYILPISKKNKLEKEDKFDFLYTWQGNILESVTASFFLVKDKKLITPKEGVLAGTTREFVIEISKDKYEIERRNVKVEELKEADEAFITSTNKEVLPVVKVDDIKIGTGKPGVVTKDIMEKFTQEVKSFK
jgi:branched-chain amino acid aminotransferase